MCTTEIPSVLDILTSKQKDRISSIANPNVSSSDPRSFANLKLK